MKFARAAAMAITTFATAVGVGFAGASSALATENPPVRNFGAEHTLVDAGGAVIQGITVTNLQPSNDPIPYPQRRGELWEATATIKAIRGTVTPIIPNFNARAANGQNYQNLAGVPTALGLHPGGIPQGDETNGKLYFDVVGQHPDSVVYNAGGRDLFIWKS
ncbi:MPT63 family protein [Mycobacterium simiae]|nr:MPT63 family protein [Mycobacterium simiae]